jgi:predicted nucleic acid-binding protein
VLACAVAGGSEVIVSGDADLLRLGEFRGIKREKVADFLAAFQARRP